MSIDNDKFQYVELIENLITNQNGETSKSFSVFSWSSSYLYIEGAINLKHFSPLQKRTVARLVFRATVFCCLSQLFIRSEVVQYTLLEDFQQCLPFLFGDVQLFGVQYHSSISFLFFGFSFFLDKKVILRQNGEVARLLYIS